MTPTRRDVLAGATALAVARPAAADTVPSLLCFGDSLTAGYGLGRTEGLVPQLSHWLADRGHRVRLIDGGMSGDTTYGGRVRIGLSLRRHRPDAVMVELGGNDMLRGWSADQAEANLDAILTTAGEGGRPLLLVGIHSPGGDAAWRKGWAAIWSRLAARHEALLLPDLYAPLAAVPPARRGPLMLRDGVHPSAQGVRLIVDHLGPVAAELVRRAQGA
nr:arylesterase [Paracoccus saliphilus]